ncbi:F-box/WD repeat-containing protein [Endozoicomonas euniceicola]|uniref:F-box/WD-40 repeat-containing protein n=1 Tax=Endozoicomonas euniceicola TaxID=1234143 RepID=A0ABY6GV41_9GAMM|nr:F-box/WD40 repeat-containing protein [Endozoicomonas euniceicola]UYM16645.1 F-box/WD-40 repeat-containing protein [Endozoicomonas euniceicola]
MNTVQGHASCPSGFSSNDASETKESKSDEVTLASLPPEILKKIFSTVEVRDVGSFERTCSNWKHAIETNSIKSLAHCRRFHPYRNRLANSEELYRLTVRNRLNCFGEEGRKSIAQLDKRKGKSHFTEELFFFTDRVLTKTEAFTSRLICSIPHSKRVRNASFSPDRTHLVTASEDGTAQIWGVVGGEWQKKHTIQHSGGLRNASFSPCGTHLVTASEDGTAQIWGLVGGEWQKTCTIRHFGGMLNASFSPDRTRLVTVSEGNTVKVCRLVGGQCQKETTFVYRPYGFVDASLSPDGVHLVGCATDGSFLIFALVEGQWQEVDTIKHGGWPGIASFSPDGTHLVTASEDGTVKIWGLVDGKWQEKCTFKHDGADPDGRGRVNDANFSPDGTHLVTASEDGTVQIWGMVDGQWQEKRIIRRSKGRSIQ